MEKPFPLPMNWRPEPELIAKLANNMGMAGWQYSPADAGEFACYWSNRPDKAFTKEGWHHKFIKNKQFERQKIGGGQSFYQRPEPPAEGSTEFCWNCVRLMQQYGHLTPMKKVIPGILERANAGQ